MKIVFCPGSLNVPKGISHAVSPLSKPVVNGDQVEANLAVALGLESEDEDNPPPQSHPPIKKMSSLSPSKQQVGIYLSSKVGEACTPQYCPLLSPPPPNCWLMVCWVGFKSEWLFLTLTCAQQWWFHLSQAHTVHSLDSITVKARLNLHNQFRWSIRDQDPDCTKIWLVKLIVP